MLKLAIALGWQDLRSTYRRSTLGQFWITLGMAVTVATIGLVFGVIFGTPLTEYLPFLASGIICWGFISSVLTDGSQSFVAAEPMIKQIPLPKYVHVLRVLVRTLLTLAHNMIIFPLVLLFLGVVPSWTILLFPISTFIALAALGGLALGLAVFATRFRDLGPIISSVVTVAFFVTPVIWQPSALKNDLAHTLLGFNPLYHLIQIMRLPLLGKLPTPENWSLSLIAAITFCIFGVVVYRKNVNHLAYWL